MEIWHSDMSSYLEEVILGKAQPYPSMVDLVVRCSVSSHDQQGNVGNDIEHYEDNFE